MSRRAHSTPAFAVTKRFTAVVLALGVLLLPLASALHFSLVAHHFCATHGVLEHDTASESNSRAKRGDHETPAPKAPDRPDRHDTCSQPIQLPVLNGSTPTVSVVVAAFVVAPATPCFDSHLPPIVPILRLAPKTPPPVLA